MATIAKFPIEPVKTLTGGPPPLETFLLGATQTFKKGELVTLSAGYVIQCPNGSLSSNSNQPTAILGVAAEDATSGTAGQYNIKVYIAHPNTVFCGNRDSGVSAVTDVGLSRGFAYASNLWTIDPATTGTNTRINIVALDTRDNLGDTQARLHFTFKTPFTQLASTS